MAKAEKTFSELKKAYYRTRLDQAAVIREAIVTECGISERTFYRWLEYPEQVTKLARPVIALHLGVSEASVFPTDMRKVVEA